MCYVKVLRRQQWNGGVVLFKDLCNKFTFFTPYLTI